MKIIQLITRLVAGGAQRLVLEAARELADRGCESEIWCGPQEGPEGSLAAEAGSRGVPLVRIESLVKQVDPIRDVRAARDIERRLRRDRPDIVHTHSSKAGIIGRIAADRAGIRAVVHTIHGWGWSPSTPSPVRRLFVAAERAAAGRGGRLVAVSRATRDEGLSLGIGTPDSYRVIHPGIDTTRFADLARLRTVGAAIRKEFGIPDGAFVAGALARLSPQKNPMMIVEAAIAEPGVHWILVGDGPLRESIERRIRQSGITSRIHLAGIQAEPSQYLGALDLFVLPSLWEGFPLALIEARAAGLPIAAASVGGVEEILPDEPAGFAFPPGDLSAFRRAVRAAAADPSGSRAAAEGLRQEAIDRFSLRRMLDSLVDLYEEITGHPLPEPAHRV